MKIALAAIAALCLLSASSKLHAVDPPPPTFLAYSTFGAAHDGSTLLVGTTATKNYASIFVQCFYRSISTITIQGSDNATAWFDWKILNVSSGILDVFSSPTPPSRFTRVKYEAGSTGLNLALDVRFSQTPPVGLRPTDDDIAFTDYFTRVSSGVYERDWISMQGYSGLILTGQATHAYYITVQHNDPTQDLFSNLISTDPVLGGQVMVTTPVNRRYAFIDMGPIHQTLPMRLTVKRLKSSPVAPVAIPLPYQLYP